MEQYEFFSECVRVCEKELMRCHELSQLSPEDGEISSTFFLELKRKHQGKTDLKKKDAGGGGNSAIIPG